MSECNLCSYGYNIQNGYCALNVPTDISDCEVAFWPGICQLCNEGYIVSPGYQCLKPNGIMCLV